ncbi:MAG: protein disulfide oxidoreductase [Candidatus Calescibacterium sp.]
MMFLNEKDRNFLIQRFRNELVEPVKIILFTQNINCEYCPETEQLLRELAETSEKIQLEVKNFVIDKLEVQKYKIDKVPAILVGNERIRYFGIPAGYEFAALIEDIVEVSRKSSFLSTSSQEKIRSLKVPINIKVFVTPTCPYCPRMVKYAHSAALLNENIYAEMIEATEFPELASQYSVYGVPKTIINEKIEIEGAVPEDFFVSELIRAAQENGKII